MDTFDLFTDAAAGGTMQPCRSKVIFMPHDSSDPVLELAPD